MCEGKGEIVSFEGRLADGDICKDGGEFFGEWVFTSRGMELITGDILEAKGACVMFDGFIVS